MVQLPGMGLLSPPSLYYATRNIIVRLAGLVVNKDVRYQSMGPGDGFAVHHGAEQVRDDSVRYVTVTLNASVDTTLVLEGFVRGGIVRDAERHAVPGGKGNNVARVLATFGHAVTATGFIAGHEGAFIRDALTEASIDAQFLTVDGHSRTSLAILERDTGVVTEIREAGVEIPPAAGDRFLELLSDLLADASAVIVSGSLPPGLPSDYYARVVKLVRDRGVQVILDTSGPPLQFGLDASPDMIKPNQPEMASLMNADASPNAMIRFARELVHTTLGPDAYVLLSLGARGAILVTKHQIIRATAPRVNPVSPVGAGDAMIAGFLHAKATSMSDAEALRHAVATGSAATLQLAPGTVALSDVRELYELVNVAEE